MNKKQRWLLLFAVPIIVMVVWYLVLQFPVWTAPEPRWYVKADEGMISSCNSDVYLDAYGAVGIEGNAQGAIPLEQAQEKIRQVLAHTYGQPLLTYFSYPVLVWVSFPDGMARLSWYGVYLVDTGETGMVGKGAALFLDALSGKPLLMIKDVTVGDPSMVCKTQIEVGARVILPVLFVAYAACVGVAALVGLLAWRKGKLEFPFRKQK